MSDFGLGPLGLLKDFETRYYSKRGDKRRFNDMTAKLKVIEEHDLSYVENTLVADGMGLILPEECGTIVRELKRFLSLPILFPPKANKEIAATREYNVYVPAAKVDMAWHQFILRTRDYQAFSDKIGFFLHHEPEDSRSAGRAKYSGELFFQTKARLGDAYGPPAPFIWGIPVACDMAAPCQWNTNERPPGGGAFGRAMAGQSV